MKLLELINSFKIFYPFECRNRNIKQQILNDKLIALKLSIVVSDIQKEYGVIEFSLPITLVAGTDKYNLTSSVLEDKTVITSTSTLTKKSTEWMQTLIASSGTPQFYSLLYQSAIPQIWLYPNPSATDTLTVFYKPNFNIYSPSSTDLQDFGDFRKTDQTWYGDTVFPTKFDKLMLMGLMKSVIPAFEQDYNTEKNLLHIKQSNAEKLDYDPEWGEY